MSHTSPASYLVWAVLSVLLGSFLVYHLWSFDRFKCLKWNNGQSGAFKRVMTYSYLFSVPLIMVYALGFVTIKYQEGFVDLPGLGIVPKPYPMWGSTAQSAIFPLTLMFSIAWALEIVTHLEELCFWYFLVNAGSNSSDWFRSLYFRVWVAGSIVAILYMPLLTIFTREDHIQNEAYTILGGSLGSLSLTISFLPILFTFPAFLANLKSEGVDSGTVIRLTKFHELNTIRVIFRFLFTLPFVVLGIDGVRPHKHVNESMLWTDLLTMVAGLGCVVSSGITLTIFFPRSVEGEIASKQARKTRSQTRSQAWSDTSSMAENRTSFSQSGRYPNHEYSTKSYALSTHDEHPLEQGYESNVGSPLSPSSINKTFYSPTEMDMYRPETLPKLTPMRPNRRIGGDVELGGIGARTAVNSMSRNALSSINPAVHQFKSPIDVASYKSPIPATNNSRFTFSRP
ncbi:hypothetical protein Moror_6189 [Moniliophthora roreri MCA 2997]|uniref:Uncharacterized protein n=1 Tax=Moniliophthora roreri (strain MCA 2997) TaxID=1381753 RepID=V2XYJ7_MONRO|nr:hypothetical protein Moror_6189 [Moniliophthora roreri MCA 2997]